MNNISTDVSKVSFLTVTENGGAGQRIDNYLVSKLKNIPKSKIYNILRRGEVRVNKGRIRPSYKLQVEDIVRIPPLNITRCKAVDFTPVMLANQFENFNLSQAIVYEDENLIIVNKPSGLAVHGGSGISFGFIELLRAARNDLEHIELIHRIDRDTSGCVMLAKSSKMLRAMHELFRNKQINKIYHALVKGYAPDQLTVDAPLMKYVLSSGERLVRVHPEGQASITKFKVLQRYSGNTLIQAEPVSGRTHQIRVHAMYKNLPIIGDEKYGNKQHNQVMRKLGFKRLFLHARELKFICPLHGKQINVQAEYDSEWIAALDNIRT